MTTIHKSLDTPITGKRGVFLRATWTRIVSLFVRYQNRRSVYSLSEFNDHQLADIGLTRDDLRYALRGGPFDDHSMDLMRSALRRRSQMNRL
ncbi:MAG: DUF1127 domain-containing protein [Hyphomicrobiales bacterium]|nr:DUF1127 domain-containing protein [Hyphomicrobiales bacterium]MCP5000795.1 DUF1127 domain-containing protein [Hyphomicrobiales bacterium]